MVYRVKTTRGGQKLIDDLNYMYRLEKKYGPKTYWKCDNTDCRSRVHTVIENETLTISKVLNEHCHPSNPSKPKIYEAKAILKEEATNSQTSVRSLIVEISASLDRERKNR